MTVWGHRNSGKKVNSQRDPTHQAASNFERTMGTIHKGSNATSETNAFQNVQRLSNTNTNKLPTLCIVGDSMIKSSNRRAINQII